MSTRWLLIGLLTSLLFSGCAPPRKQLETLGVLSAVGYDLSEKGKLIGSAVLPNFTETGKEQIDVLSATGVTSKQLRFNMSRLSERNLVAGQIRVVLFGEELAKKGLLQLSDTLFRDAEIGSQIQLAVGEGKAHDFFTKRYPDKPSVDIYLYRMIRKEIEQNTMPRSNLHRFLMSMYDTGSDPVMPYLRLGKDDVIMDGLAVFDNDRYVGNINAEQARYLSYLSGGAKNGEIDADLDGGAHVILMYLRMDRKVEPKVVLGHPHFDIDFTVEGAVTEYMGDEDLDEPQVLREVEQRLAAVMKKQMTELIELLQQTYHSDPVGFGEIYRSRGLVKQLTHEQWHEMYAKADFTVNVRVKILQTGMIH